MGEPKKRLCKILLEDVDLEGTVDNAITHLEAFKSFYSDYELELEVHYTYDSSQLQLKGYREETDEEYFERLHQKDLIDQKSREKELELLRYLKEKYEGTT